MKPIILQLRSGSKIVADITLEPELQLRLAAFADANGKSEIEMIKHALWFAIGSEEKSNGLDLNCPSEEDIVAFAGDLLAKAA